MCFRKLQKNKIVMVIIHMSTDKSKNKIKNDGKCCSNEKKENSKNSKVLDGKALLFFPHVFKVTHSSGCCYTTTKAGKCMCST